jgi:putative lipoprotein
VDPQRHYAVRARITDAGGRVFWATPRVVPVLTYGHPHEVELVLNPAGSSQAAMKATYVYECRGLDAVARLDPKGVFLFLPDRTVLLTGTPAASGAKYTDGSVTFWSKGEEALIEVDGKRYQRCRNNPARAVWEDAKLNGVDFRAVGNEPAWYLEIYDKGRPEKIDFVADYGKDFYTFLDIRRETDSGTGRTRYRSQMASHRLEVELTPSPCTDSMSGEAYATAVTVRLNHDIYRGCGTPLH